MRLETAKAPCQQICDRGRASRDVPELLGIDGTPVDEAGDVAAGEGALLRGDGGERDAVLRSRDIRGRVPPSGVGAVGKWPAGATAESLAQAGRLPTAAASEVVNRAGNPGGCFV